MAANIDEAIIGAFAVAIDVDVKVDVDVELDLDVVDDVEIKAEVNVVVDVGFDVEVDVNVDEDVNTDVVDDGVVVSAVGLSRNGSSFDRSLLCIRLRLLSRKLSNLKILC